MTAGVHIRPRTRVQARRALACMLAALVVACLVAGPQLGAGTLAYVQAHTDASVNTFVPGATTADEGTEGDETTAETGTVQNATAADGSTTAASDEEASEQAEASASSDTGDSGMLALWVALFALSAVAAAVAGRALWKARGSRQ